jgi:hypothetical protein
MRKTCSSAKTSWMAPFNATGAGQVEAEGFSMMMRDRSTSAASPSIAHDVEGGPGRHAE